MLDENIITNQCQLLKSWRIPFRKIGYEIGQLGMKDKEIISLLHGLSNPTFFTRDDDFFDHSLCHSGYCLVYLSVKKDEAAFFIHRFLFYQDFNTKAKRMGSVIKISHNGISVWPIHSANLITLHW